MAPRSRKQEQVVEAAPTQRLVPEHTAVMEPPPLPPPAYGEPPPPREWWPWLIALLVVVLAGLGAAYWLTRDDHEASRGRAATTAAVRPAPRPAGGVSVPEVVGMSRAGAIAQLRASGLQPQVSAVASAKPAGTVLGQAPQAGSRIARGSAVALEVAAGPTARPAAGSIAVPSVVGSQVADAITTLSDAGLSARVRNVASEKPRGRVLSQQPAARGKLARSAPVALAVSKGPSTVAVPGVTGQTEQQAVDALSSAGLIARVVSVPSPQPAGTVVAQAPAAGGEVARGKPVRLNVSGGGQAGKSGPAAGTRTTPAAAAAPSTVPDVEGMALADARSALRRAGMAAEVRQVPSNEPAGTVVGQAQPAGAPIPANKRTLITVSNGETPGQGTGAPTTVPDIKGLRLADAQAKLRQAGIVGELRQVPSIEPEGTVLGQAKQPGTAARRGDHMTYTASNGQRPAG